MRRIYKLFNNDPVNVGAFVMGLALLVLVIANGGEL